MKSKNSADLHSGSSSSSSFFEPKHKRSLAFVGTPVLLLGVGFSGSSPALSNGVIECTDANSVTATSDPSENRTNIEEVLVDSSLVCLRGDFVIDYEINLDNAALEAVVQSAHFYGDGESSLRSLGIFGVLNFDSGEVTVENLTIKDSSARGYFDNEEEMLASIVYAGSVIIKNSTFSENIGRAITSYGSVSISESTFLENNKTDLYLDGGAVWAVDTVTIENSAFVGNRANLGGAVFAIPNEETGLDVTNSTFKNNVASGSGAEGGALFAGSGQVIFSTFVVNTAPDPVGGYEVPGNAIHKSGPYQFNVGGNIFAGIPNNPQLGYGAAGLPFNDLGGNVFTTSSATETDITQDDSSVFGASLISIFGTATPALATFSPNSSGTQTIGLVAGSPALNIVPNDVPFTSVTVDQRGATRSHPADAGAFEGVVAPTPTPTPSTAPAALAKTGSQDSLWATIAAGSMLAVGGLVTFVASRLRRQTK
jgi:LPXTG-motif cell wall-anchored protein